MNNKINEAEDFLLYDCDIPYKTKLSKQFFWPIYRHKVAITGFNFQNLNLFEYFVLKFTEAAGKEKSVLKKLTAMEEDLIDFLQQRLYHKNYLDENYYITESGKQVLHEITEVQENAEENSNSNHEPDFFYIYSDSFTGSLLPKITAIKEEKVIQSNITQEGKNLIVFKKTTSVGKASENDDKKIWAFDFPVQHDQDISKKEVEQLIIKAMKDSLLPAQSNFKVESINETEKVYLAVYFILQEGNTEKWLITEGFSNDFSTVFVPENLKKGDQDEILKSRDDIVQKFINIPEKIKKELTEEQIKKLSPYYKYGEIFKKLKIIEIEKPALQKTDVIDTTDKQKTVQKIKKTLISNLYEVMEWSFFHSTDEIKNKDKVLKSLKGKAKAEIKEKALKAIKKYSIIVEEKNKKNLNVKYGSILYSLKGEPQLMPLVVFHLIAEDKNFGILIKKAPQLIDALIELTDLRNRAKHGDDIDIESEKIDLYYSMCYNILNLLFPAVQNKIDTKLSQKDISYYSETENKIRVKKMKAEMKVEEALGFALQRKLPSEIYTDIVDIEKFFIDSEGPDINVINNFYNIFDKIFTKINRSLSQPSKAIKIQDCIEKAENAGFVMDNEKFEVFTQINIERLQKALENHPISLQASFLVFLFKIEQKQLEKIKKKCPSMIVTIHSIAKLRGHGDILIIRKEVPELIKNSIKEAQELLFGFIKCAYNLNII
ncbi:hypothetical protein [Treponema denticola]|uniref:hypothetical protein n=1 Tax=Treponema denticola TaxID=158 RepID=UPI0020A4C30F|nr:hypothetical protein [Treponema denticola]UTC82221.1 hypothetical protein HGJ18_03005 [Treponema denticola]